MPMRRQVLLVVVVVVAIVVAVATWRRPTGPDYTKRDATTTRKIEETAVRTAIHHVLMTGQSLALGAQGAPALSKEQPFQNLSFGQGVLLQNVGLESFAPLVERVEETMSSAFANSVTSSAPNNDYVMLISIAASGGTAYRDLKKGRPVYTTGLAQIAAAKKLAARDQKTYVAAAIANVHGEAEHLLKNPTYDRDIAEWQRDLEQDIGDVVGDRALVLPMFITQISSWPAYGDATSDIPRQQLAAHTSSNGRVILVGPKYHLAYAVDGVHLTNEGYRHMGEDYAKAYRWVVTDKRAWEPLRPSRIEQGKGGSSKSIDVTFLVPAPPIVLDTQLVSNPGSFGFEYFEDNERVTIENVRVTAPDRISIDLAREPSPRAAKRLRYAFTSAPGTPAGPRSGPRGNLRDSDRTSSRFGYPLHNWCVHFDEAVH